MTDMGALLQRLDELHQQVDAAKARQRAAGEEVHRLVVARNDVLREINREHGVHPKELKDLGRVNLQLAYRIVAGQDR
jgi:hypothetical protein